MPTCYGAAVLTVVLVYCAWRSYAQARRRREQMLRRRVAYMLWVLAETGGASWSLAGPHTDDYGYE